MKKILITVASVMCACAVYLNVQAQEAGGNDLNGLVNDVEALAGNESGDRIICKCQDGVLTNDRCLASNDDDRCAQSDPGGNINCRDYSSNC